MLKNIVKRLMWLFIERKKLSKKLKGFSAHWTSLADDRTQFSEHNWLGRRSVFIGSRIGKCTYVVGAEIRNADIGAFCSIGPETLIGGLGGHPVSWLSTHPAFYTQPNQACFSFNIERSFTETSRTKVGNDVWIGARVTVLDGVKVGNGSIIAAGAVVVKDVPPYSIIGGVPARLIRKRFDDRVIEKLENMQWWNAELESLSKVALKFTEREDWRLGDVELIEKQLSKYVVNKSND